MSFQPGYSPLTNQMVSLPGSTPTYDLDGNVTYDGANNYGWDANGNMVTINSTTSTFDALGRLASQTWPGEIMWLPAGLGKIFWHGQVADVAVFNLPGGDQAIISEESGVTRYAHADHLGSGRLESGTDGTYFESMAYAPYGETYAQSKFDSGRFTGMTVMFGLGLYDSQTREYSDAGRWVSPDPAGVAAVDPTDPQTWNRYAYVRGNPMNTTDISGLAPCPPPAEDENYGQDLNPIVQSANCEGNDPGDECDSDYCPQDPGSDPMPGDPIQPPNIPFDPRPAPDLCAVLGCGPSDPPYPQPGLYACGYGHFCLVTTDIPTMTPDEYWQELATQITQTANPANIAELYGLSVLAGAAGWAAATYYESAGTWLMANQQTVIDCGEGALSPFPGGPGVAGNVCSAAVVGGTAAYDYYQGHQH